MHIQGSFLDKRGEKFVLESPLLCQISKINSQENRCSQEP